MTFEALKGLEENPENNKVNGGLFHAEPPSELGFSFSYPDFNRRPRNRTVSALTRSWAVPPIGNFTLPRRSADRSAIYILNFYLRLDDTVHWTDIHATRRVIMTHALYAGVGVDNVNITLRNRFSGAFWKTRAASDAVI